MGSSSMQSALFAPNRPLRPQQKTRKVASAVSPEHCTLLVRVVRASDVPLRLAKKALADPAPTHEHMRYLYS